MLPYHEIPPLRIGPLTAYPFGFLVGVAIMVGITLAERRTEQYKMSQQVLASTIRWLLIGGFIGAHLVSAIFYFPERVAENPLYLFKIWDGISSIGGFIGGALGVILYLRLSKNDFWPYGDAIMYGFAFAWIFGRLGCTVAFDHPGSLTTFVLGMPYPSGYEVSPGIRHNLGFYEFLWAIGLSLYFYSQRLKPHFAGFYLIVFIVAYMPLRFALDFLRAEDKRYLGLTAAQYGTVALLIVGVVLIVQRSRRAPVLTPVPLAKATKRKAAKAR